MPTSYHHNIPTVVEWMVKVRPARMLDIGIGYGKYGFLAREYVDQFLGNLRLDGVEVHEGYTLRSPARAFYDRLIIGEFPACRSKLNPPYDLALMVDVLEHYTAEAGALALAAALELAEGVLISTPLNYPQGPVQGNDYERHRSEWRPNDLMPFGEWMDSSDDRSTLGVLWRQP